MNRRQFLKTVIIGPLAIRLGLPARKTEAWWLDGPVKAWSQRWEDRLPKDGQLYAESWNPPLQFRGEVSDGPFFPVEVHFFDYEMSTEEITKVIHKMDAGEMADCDCIACQRKRGEL